MVVFYNMLKLVLQ